MTDPRLSQRPLRSRDPRARLMRDADRFTHRDTGIDRFWQSVGVLGAVGWTIVLATVGGALLGRWLHQKWETSAAVTALLVAAGASVGMRLVWRLIQEKK